MQIRAVDDAIAQEPVDAILVESMFIGAVGLLSRPRAERPAIVNLGIIPLGVESRDTAPFGLGILPRPGALGRVRNAVLDVLTKKLIFGGVQKQAEQILLEATGKEPDGFFMSGASRADAIVQFTVPGFEYERSDLPETVHFVGPLSRATKSDGVLPEWWSELDGSRPVVHVSQGTIANTDYDELITPTMTALADDDVLVVVSTGGRPLSTLPSPLPANVRVAEYLPHDRLLPLTDVYVSNGGYGGVHYALEHGVPLVVAGATEDKAEVAARVQWTGTGVRLRTNRPTPEQVGSAVRRVLADPGYAERTRKIGAEIEASTGLAGLETVLETLVPKTVQE
ncbi:glycosyltransferase [Microbacterium sp. A588]